MALIDRLHVICVNTDRTIIQYVEGELLVIEEEIAGSTYLVRIMQDEIPTTLRFKTTFFAKAKVKLNKRLFEHLMYIFFARNGQVPDLSYGYDEETDGFILGYTLKMTSANDDVRLALRFTNITNSLYAMLQNLKQDIREIVNNYRNGPKP